MMGHMPLCIREIYETNEDNRMVETERLSFHLHIVENVRYGEACTQLWINVLRGGTIVISCISIEVEMISHFLRKW